MDFGQLVSTFGFPIACCMVMGVFIYQMWNRINATLEKVTETNSQLVLTNQSLISSMDCKINKIEEKVDTIADKIGK